jgi:hypothetical protein
MLRLNAREQGGIIQHLFPEGDSPDQRTGNPYALQVADTITRHGIRHA